MIFKAYMDKEEEFEREFKGKKGDIISNLEYMLAANGMSDHGMVEYLLDLWDQLMISYQNRLSFLELLQSK